LREERDVEADPFPETRVYVDPAETRLVSMGLGRSSQANALDQDLWEFTDNLTLFAGNHTLLFGTSNQLFRFNNLFIQDFYGYYEFRGGFDADLDGDGDTEPVATGIDAFRLGRPSFYRFSYASQYEFDGQGRLLFVCPGGATTCDDEDLVASRSVMPGERPRAAFTGAQLGLYAQDEWNVTPDFRLT